MTKLRRALVPGALLGVLAGLLAAAPPARAVEPEVDLVTIRGSINPASANYIIEAIARAERRDAGAVLIELDTPGGLVASTKDIIQAILNAGVPVIVYVAPSGAWASSAGVFITISAHVAAMAPGTSIGAAHPVSVGGGGGEQPGKEGEGTRDIAAEKAENALVAYIEAIARQRDRNVEWAAKAVRESVAVAQDEALELGVIDLVAETRGQLLEAIDGREVRLSGRTVTLHTAQAPVVPVDMTLVQRLFNFLADPNVAVVLFLAGLLGLYVEFNNPGLILPGAAGATCLLLAAIAFQILPFSWVGLLLIAAGIALLVAEIFVTSFGLLFVAGLALFLLGGTMLFERPDLSDLTVSFWSVLLPAVLGMGIFAAIIVFAVGRSFRARQTAGVHELIGLVGRSATGIDPEGKVFVRGEYWSAESDEAIPEGQPVEIVAVEGMRLRVRRPSGPP